MYHQWCDFTELAGEAMMSAMRLHIKNQLDLTEGLYFMYDDPMFHQHVLSPAHEATGQAILQHFSQEGCPFSTIRLGYSLSTRNMRRGPIVSDEMAVRYLLKGLEAMSNALHVRATKPFIENFMQRQEFIVMCQLSASYLRDMKNYHVCGEIVQLIEYAMKKPATGVKH